MHSGPDEFSLGLVQCVQRLADVGVILDEWTAVVEEAQQSVEFWAVLGRFPVQHALDSFFIHGDSFSSHYVTKKLDGLLQE